MFAFTNASGMVMMSAPDVCKTPAPPAPPAPVPYPSMASASLLSDTSQKVTICGGNAATLKSKTSTCNGNEAGVGGGVVSGVNINETKFVKGSMKVRIEGQGGLRLGDQCTLNKQNTVGMIAAPSQSKVRIGG